MHNILSTSGFLWATCALTGGDGYFSGTDLSTGEEVYSINLGSMITPEGFAVNKNNTIAWIADSYNDQIIIVDLLSQSVTGSVTTLQPDGLMITPFQVALSPDETRLYVTGDTAKTLEVIDTLNNIRLKGIDLPGHARGVTVSPDGKTVYVALYNTDQIGFIDIATSSVIDTVFVGRLPMEIIISKEGTTLYVANQYGNSIATLDTGTKEVAHIMLNDSPYSIALSASERYLYVGTQSLGVYTLDLASAEVISSVQLSYPCSSVGVSPDDASVYAMAYEVDGPQPTPVDVMDSPTTTIIGTLYINGIGRYMQITA
ncbi:beta-propeller fold lactonase family protein [Pseudescherichia sp.]|uniref:beta-propeller fold lactonase family protein n=1 Tax=Pseudescherichia sp. TaxID=2055881 RepID=UPI0028AC00BE|nr:beta-propeller fold lactonase family protein [Pseudescherichia sp.]